jgi:hypothetical protein
LHSATDFVISNSRERSWVVVITRKWLGVSIIRNKKIFKNSTYYSPTPHIRNHAFIDAFLGVAINKLPIDTKLAENDFSKN